MASLNAVLLVLCDLQVSTFSCARYVEENT
jgi:hypothetical protein